MAKRKQDGNEKASNTPYDDAFRTMLNDCTPLVIPLVNELFDKGYKGDEKVIFHPDTHFINQEGGHEEKRITDSYFSIVSDTTRHYIIECQSTSDSSMLVRLFEYVMQAALDSSDADDYRLRVEIPEAAVLYLRSTGKTPEKMRVEISTSEGDFGFDIPLLRMRDYKLVTIFERNLFFLIPFYIFTKESQFEAMEAGATSMDELVEDYDTIMEELEAGASAGTITQYQRVTIIEMSKIVLDHIAKNYAGVREKVSSAMGGTVLEHESKTIYNEGREEGREEVRTEMLQCLLENGLDAEYLAKVTGIDVAEIERVRDATGAGPKE